MLLEIMHDRRAEGCDCMLFVLRKAVEMFRVVTAV
jgi:hypothetical protein